MVLSAIVSDLVVGDCGCNSGSQDERRGGLTLRQPINKGNGLVWFVHDLFDQTLRAKI